MLALMQYVTYLSAALLPILALTLWGILWPLGSFFPLLLPFFFFFPPANLWCHHSSISSTLTMKAHYHNRSVPGLITREVTWFRSCLFSVETTRSLPEESWKMKTSNAVGIQWHSSLQSSQSGPEKLVSTYLGSDKDWTMGGCVQSLFSSPIYRHYPRNRHSQEDNAQGRASCLDYSSHSLRPPLIFFLAF